MHGAKDQDKHSSQMQIKETLSGITHMGKRSGALVMTWLTHADGAWSVGFLRGTQEELLRCCTYCLHCRPLLKFYTDDQKGKQSEAS